MKATEGTCCFWWPVILWPKETPTHTIYDSIIILRTFSFIFTIIIYGSASALQILFCDSMCFPYINAFVPSCVGAFLPSFFFFFNFLWFFLSGIQLIIIKNVPIIVNHLIVSLKTVLSIEYKGVARFKYIKEK